MIWVTGYNTSRGNGRGKEVNGELINIYFNNDFDPATKACNEQCVYCAADARRTELCNSTSFNL